MSSIDLTDLATALVSDGVAGHEVAVLGVVRAARAAGISEALVDVLADATQPEVARQRAFGMVAAAMAFGPVDDPALRRAAA